MIWQLALSPEPDNDGMYVEDPPKSEEESGKYIFQSLGLRYLNDWRFSRASTQHRNAGKYALIFWGEV